MHRHSLSPGSRCQPHRTVGTQETDPPLALRGPSPGSSGTDCVGRRRGEERRYRSGPASRTGLTRQPAACLALTLTQRAPPSAPDATAGGRSGHGAQGCRWGLPPLLPCRPGVDRHRPSLNLNCSGSIRKGREGPGRGPAAGRSAKGSRAPREVKAAKRRVSPGSHPQGRLESPDAGV